MKNKISVAMASYNGEKYIEEQINSILTNLLENDELVISDDGSTDNTLNIIKKIQSQDDRIKLYSGPKKGVKQNFANAISHCTGRYIFLSDQDDVWSRDKVKKIVNVFEEKKCLVVQHDCTVTDSNKNTILDSYFKYRKCGPGMLKNIYKNTYIGCCMAFDASLIPHILPIPNNIDMHDQWIGLIGEKYMPGVFINDKLIIYRRHEGTASDLFHSHKLSVQIRDRLNLIMQLIRRKK